MQISTTGIGLSEKIRSIVCRSSILKYYSGRDNRYKLLTFCSADGIQEHYENKMHSFFK